MLIGDECMGTVTKTYEVMDAAGNMVSCTQTITIVAPQPVWNNPPGNLQLPCNVIPQSSTLSWTRGTGVCQTTGQVQSMIIGMVGLCEGSVTEYWEYTDVCGVTISHSRLVFYKIDTEAPQLIGVPADLFIPCGSKLPAWANVSAIDNCDGLVPVSRKQVQGGTKCGNIFYERIWTTIDECGNSSLRKQTIRFLDEEPPVLEVPADMVINCADPVPAPSYNSYDDCSWNEVIYKEKRTNHNDCEYTLVRTWTATDGCGNAVQKSQTIQVIDPDAPVIVIVNPVLKDLAVGGSMDVYGCESPRTFISDIEVHDCCASVSIEAYDQLLSIGSCAADGFLQKWRCGYVVTDGAGNESEFYFFVYLRDTTTPVLYNIPKDTILPCHVQLPEFDSSLVFAADNCDLQNAPHLSEMYYYDPLDSSEFALLRRWKIGDACGNFAEASNGP
jgi:hypothetical protein